MSVRHLSAGTPPPAGPTRRGRDGGVDVDKVDIRHVNRQACGAVGHRHIDERLVDIPLEDDRAGLADVLEERRSEDVPVIAPAAHREDDAPLGVRRRQLRERAVHRPLVASAQRERQRARAATAAGSDLRLGLDPGEVADSREINYIYRMINIV